MTPVLLEIPQLLDVNQIAVCRDVLTGANWTDGRATAGYLSNAVKQNQQLAENDPVARRLGKLILDALDINQLFISAALPLKIVPPLFNRYAGGQHYGGHIDGAIRPVFGTAHRVRTDLSATIFLSPPEEYDGGELVIEDSSGSRRIKLPAGDMVLYSGTSVHLVEPVTRGARLASFFRVQSMVREDSKREVLFAIDNALQRLGRDVPGHQSLVEIAGAYHNLLRLWSDT